MARWSTVQIGSGTTTPIFEVWVKVPALRPSGGIVRDWAKRASFDSHEQGFLDALADAQLMVEGYERQGYEVQVREVWLPVVDREQEKWARTQRARTQGA